MDFTHQIAALFILAIPVASISWSVTHEEIFREPREWCICRSTTCRTLLQRKLFYLFTCEYCFSHYVVAAVLAVTRYTLLYNGWRGYLIAGFSVVWLANVYMSFFGRLRGEIKAAKIDTAAAEAAAERVSSSPVVGRGR